MFQTISLHAFPPIQGVAILHVTSIGDFVPPAKGSRDISFDTIAPKEFEFHSTLRTLVGQEKLEC